VLRHQPRAARAEPADGAAGSTDRAQISRHVGSWPERRAACAKSRLTPCQIAAARKAILHTVARIECRQARFRACRNGIRERVCPIHHSVDWEGVPDLRDRAQSARSLQSGLRLLPYGVWCSDANDTQETFFDRAKDRVGCAKSPCEAKRTWNGVRAILRTQPDARNDHSPNRPWISPRSPPSQPGAVSKHNP
jgi:hypothetical protein